MTWCSDVDYTWRMFASSEEIEPAMELETLCPDQHIDHWFDDIGHSCFSGTGPRPVSPHVTETVCECAVEASVGPCWWCADTGVMLFWSPLPPHMIAQAFKAMLIELEQLPIGKKP